MLDVCGISKSYRGERHSRTVLRHVSFTLGAAELAVVWGANGSGKTTLLNIVAALDRPDRGEVRLDGTALHRLNPRGQEIIRRRDIGFVFQHSGLLPTLSVRENVEMTLLLDESSVARRRVRVQAALASLGVEDLAEWFPCELSACEKQRVAIARALANRPRLMLADEPTEGLDPESAMALIGSMQSLARTSGVAFLIATRDAKLFSAVDAGFLLRDGRLVREPEAVTS